MKMKLGNHTSAALICAVLAVHPGLAMVATRQGGPTDTSRFSSSTLLLRRAKADWPKFMSRFRTALKGQDRMALYSMTSSSLRKNCVASEGRDIRKEFFADADALRNYLELVTPGMNKYHEYDEGSVELDPGGKTPRRYVGFGCWALGFEYHRPKGWILTEYDQPCEGC